MNTRRTLRLEDLGIRPVPGMTLPTQAAFSPSGALLYYLAPGPDQRLALFVFDLKRETERLIVAAPAVDDDGPETLEEELRKQRLRQTLGGIGSFRILDEASAIVNIGGALRLVDLSDGSEQGGYDLSGLVQVQGYSGDRLIATTGRAIVLAYRDGHRETLVAVAGEGMSIGVAEYVAQEELGRMTGLWLDPSGRYLAYTEIDESRITPHRIVRTDVHPNVVEEYRYPFAGAANAHVALCLVELESRARTVIEHVDDQGYLANVVWLDSDQLTFSTLNRAQSRLNRSIYRVSDQSRLVLGIEQGNPWVNLPEREFAFEGDLLTTSEARGDCRLVRLRADGTQLEVGDMVLRRLLGVEGTTALVVATGETPVQEWLYRVDLTTGGYERLAGEYGVAFGVLAPSGDSVLVEASSRDLSPVALVHTNKSITVLRSTHAPFDLCTPEFFEIEASTGETLYGALYLPAEDTAKGAPLIISVYGGPRAQLVTDSYGLTLDLQAQYLASRGAVVLKLDNRGSYGRGRAFEAYLHGGFGAVELADQLEAVAYCQHHYGTDPERVGIYGWSYGGYLTLIAMTRAPEVFKVGVAGAPCVDFRWYDTAYTERYLGNPAENPEAYDATSVLGSLGGLRGRLLVIHGLMDENVHFGHTASLLARAHELGRELELVVLPGSRHAPVDTASLTRLARSRSKFLLEHLGLSTEETS
ncbi:MAG: S9 family peptidase [Ferrimicrobium sp.]